MPFNPGGAACDPLTAAVRVRPCTLGGEDLGRAPKYNYSRAGVYSQDFGPYNVSLSVSGRGQDDIILVGGATSSAVVTQKAYSLVDARAALNGTWRTATCCGCR